MLHEVQKNVIAEQTHAWLPAGRLNCTRLTYFYSVCSLSCVQHAAGTSCLCARGCFLLNTSMCLCVKNIYSCVFVPASAICMKSNTQSLTSFRLYLSFNMSRLMWSGWIQTEDSARLTHVWLKKEPPKKQLNSYYIDLTQSAFKECTKNYSSILYIFRLFQGNVPVRYWYNWKSAYDDGRKNITEKIEFPLIRFLFIGL